MIRIGVLNNNNTGKIMIFNKTQNAWVDVFCITRFICRKNSRPG